MRSRDEKTDRPTQASTSFEIGKRELDARTSIVSVAGELDLVSAPQLKWMLVDAFEEGASQVVLDLSQTTFMDSTALGVLVGVERNLEDGERFAIVCAQAVVLRIFEISGMDGAFSIFATLEDALAGDRADTARAI